MYTENEVKTFILLPCLAFIATVAVSLRTYLRVKSKNFAWDDGLLCFSLLVVYLQIVGRIYYSTQEIDGRPITSLAPHELTLILKVSYFAEIGYTVLVSTIKLSILLSYHRIFGCLKWFKIAVYILMILEVFWFIGVLFSVIFQCTPVERAWSMVPGTCIDLIPFFWGNAISNCVIDYLILCLPIVPVLRLQIKPVQKCLLLLSFALGSIACIASTFRTVSTGTYNEADLSQTSFESIIWPYLEPMVGIVSAALPFLTQLFGTRFLRFFKFISVKTSMQAAKLKPVLAQTFQFSTSSKNQNRKKQGTVEATELAANSDIHLVGKMSDEHFNIQEFNAEASKIQVTYEYSVEAV